MKNIHVSYNVFDNEELLEASIRKIKEIVSEVTVIYQEISNFGQQADQSLFDVIDHLKNQNLIDNLVLYKTNTFLSPQLNELKKNNFGYQMAKEKKLDYHMGMACDEFYFRDEFLDLLNILEENPVDLVTSYMYTYYKSSKYRFKEIENYVVPVLNKVYQDGRNYKISSPSPILIDPTRKMIYDSYICLPKEKPLMHHLSHVRKDFRKKLENSTANINWYDKIDKMVSHYESWVPIEDAFLFGDYVELEETDRFEEELTF